MESAKRARAVEREQADDVEEVSAVEKKSAKIAEEKPNPHLEIIASQRADIAMLKERLEAMAKRKEELEKEVLKKRDEKPRYMRELLEKCERALMKIGILEQKATDSEARRAKLLDDMHNLEESQNQLWKIVVKLSETIDELQAVVEEKTQREQEASARRIAIEAELARRDREMEVLRVELDGLRQLEELEITFQTEAEEREQQFESRQALVHSVTSTEDK